MQRFETGSHIDIGTAATPHTEAQRQAHTPSQNVESSSRTLFPAQTTYPASTAKIHEIAPKANCQSKRIHPTFA
jgi:hypothetical protein